MRAYVVAANGIVDVMLSRYDAAAVVVMAIMFSFCARSIVVDDATCC